MPDKITPLRIIQPTPPAAEVPAEVIATSITQIAKAMKDLTSTRLGRNAIVTLIHAASKVPKRDIVAVMGSLENLERDWLKPKPKA
jgi:hypothetical protein